jgi:hypothetical protein
VVQVCLWSAQYERDFLNNFVFIGVFCFVQKYIVHPVLTLLSDSKMAFFLSAQHAANEAADDGWRLQYVISEDVKLRGMSDCERGQDSGDKLCREKK